MTKLQDDKASGSIVQDTKMTGLSASNDLASGRELKLWGVAQQS